MTISKRKLKYLEIKLILVPLHPQQMSHGVLWEWTCVHPRGDVGVWTSELRHGLLNVLILRYRTFCEKSTVIFRSKKNSFSLWNCHGPNRDHWISWLDTVLSQFISYLHNLFLQDPFKETLISMLSSNPVRFSSDIGLFTMHDVSVFDTQLTDDRKRIHEIRLW